MTKDTYLRVVRSIRDNGLRYTAQHAIDVDDFDALAICDAVADNLQRTDWLAMRAQFARNEKPAVAIRLTCMPWLLRRDMDPPCIWS
jgi:hypothetical protein